METDIQQLFVDTVRQEFGPLVAEGNLKQTQTLFDQPFLTTKVAFFGRNVSLELSLDGRDECVDCYVARIVDGRPTDRWGYENGNLRRYHLTELLRRNGGVDTSSLFTNLAGLELAELVPISVRDYARMVASYGQGILSDQYPIRGVTHPEREPETPEALVAFLDALPADYDTSRLPNAYDDYLLAVCAQLLNEAPSVNRAFAAAVDNRMERPARDGLANFVYRVAMLAVRQKSRDQLRGGFVALALGVASDIGVLHENMAVLYRSAQHLGLDPNSLFALAIDRTGDPLLARIMTAFKEGTAVYKRLNTFQLKETDGPSGIVYLSIQSDDIPEGWL